MAETTPPPPSEPVFSRPVALDSMPQNGTYTFSETPTEAETAAIKAFLDLRGLRKMRFSGVLEPTGTRGWRLSAELGASVTQECVATLEPVRTRIDVPVSVRFLPHDQIPERTDETVLEDDIEPLQKDIDLGAVALEALTLALPAYPRSEGAILEPVTQAPPGQEPIQESALKPFAGLADLKKKLDEQPE